MASLFIQISRTPSHCLAAAMLLFVLQSCQNKRETVDIGNKEAPAPAPAPAPMPAAGPVVGGPMPPDPADDPEDTAQFTSTKHCVDAGKSDAATDRCCEATESRINIATCAKDAASLLQDKATNYGGTLPNGESECVSWCLNRRTDFDSIIAELKKLSEGGGVTTTNTPPACTLSAGTPHETLTVAQIGVGKVFKLHGFDPNTVAVFSEKTDKSGWYNNNESLRGLQEVILEAEINSDTFKVKSQEGVMKSYAVHRTCVSYACISSGCAINCNAASTYTNATNKAVCCAATSPYKSRTECTQ